MGGTGPHQHHVRLPPNQPLSPAGGTLPQASPVSVYLFPGERSGAQPPLPPVGVLAGSLGSCSEAEEGEKEKEGDGDTMDSDEFCILDAPGLGIPVCGGQAGQGQDVGEAGGGRKVGRWGWEGLPGEAALSLGFAGAGGFPEEERHGDWGIRVGGEGRWLAGGRGGPFGCKGADLRAPKYLWECHMQARPRPRATRLAGARDTRLHPRRSTQIQAGGQ